LPAPLYHILGLSPWVLLPFLQASCCCCLGCPAGAAVPALHQAGYQNLPQEGWVSAPGDGWYPPAVRA
jgi:hypothetical protein